MSPVAAIWFGFRAGPLRIDLMEVPQHGPEEMELLQHIGFDSLGEEMYVGDILKLKVETGSGKITWVQLVANDWSEGCILHKNGGVSMDSVEIIGNIYENPALIEK